jgi:hypothetical protein
VYGADCSGCWKVSVAVVAFESYGAAAQASSETPPKAGRVSSGAA